MDQLHNISIPSEMELATQREKSVTVKRSSQEEEIERVTEESRNKYMGKERRKGIIETYDPDGIKRISQLKFEIMNEEIDKWVN